MSIQTLKDEMETLTSHKFEEEFEIISKSIERIKFLANDLANLQNPEVIDYTSTNKMIKLKNN